MTLKFGEHTTAFPAQQVIDRLFKVVTDPVEWLERNNVVVWSAQREIIQSVNDNRRTAVPSAHNVGKSFIAGTIACWWIDSHPAGSAFVVTTAPTATQVKSILWQEIRKQHRALSLAGRTNLTEWYVGDDELVAIGRKPSAYEPDAFQGIHAQYVLVIIDEATGVPAGLWDAIESLISNENSRVLAIGNPTNPSSKFAQVCKQESAWNVISIDGLESPNFTGEHKELPPHITRSLLSQLWVDEKLEEWGEDSPMYQARVRGRFPDEDAEDKVMPWQLLTSCRPYAGAKPDEVLANYNEDDLTPVELGVDIGASAGGDETVIQERRGVLPYRVWRFRSADDEVVKGQIIAKARETGATAIKIDAIGVGWGIVGSVRTALKGEDVRVYGINVSKRSTQPKKFVKLRDQLWWVGRDLTKEQRWDLSLVDDKTLAELNAALYDLDGQGRISVHAKDEVREYLGRSPDSADALLMAYLSPTRKRPKARARGGG